MLGRRQCHLGLLLQFALASFRDVSMAGLQHVDVVDWPASLCFLSRTRSYLVKYFTLVQTVDLEAKSVRPRCLFVVVFLRIVSTALWTKMYIAGSVQRSHCELKRLSLYSRSMLIACKEGMSCVVIL